MVDDDEDFLELVRACLPGLWHTSLFADSDQFLRHLKVEPPFWEADAWNQQEIVRRWREAGASLAVELVSYWSKYTERYALTKVCIVDQVMPKASGLEVLRQLRGWHGQRVLLTGKADDSLAIRAFNEGLIDRFVRKEHGRPISTLFDLVQDLQYRADQRLDQVWRASLSVHQSGVLQHPDVAHALRAYLESRVVEHIVIGQPFGVLGLSADGVVKWVPLMLCEGNTPRELTDYGIRVELGLSPASAAVGPTETFGSDQTGLVGCTFDIDAGLGSHGYASWLRRQSTS